MYLPRKATLLVLVVFLLGMFSGIYLSWLLTPDYSPADVSEDQVSLLTDREYFGSVGSLLSGADRSVRMIMFDIKYYPDYPDSPSNSLLSELAEASGRGVNVRIITDEWLTEKPVLSMLKEAGVDIKFDSKDITTHAKLIIIDSEIVIIGSTNWSYHSIDKNHEANVIIRSPSLARQFGAYFENLWSES